MNAVSEINRAIGREGCSEWRTKVVTYAQKPSKGPQETVKTHLKSEGIN